MSSPGNGNPSGEKLIPREVVVRGTFVEVTNASIDQAGTDKDTEYNTANEYTFIKITATNTYYIWRPKNELNNFKYNTHLDGTFTIPTQDKKRTAGGAGGQNHSRLNNSYLTHT